ncbi:MAG: hypothetical protein KAG66_09695 [Methylococcales bacterium]|nr:hypothetical protein [Methylococcales bacterium]
MRTFTLQLEDADPDQPEVINFQSEDGHEAFGILSRKGTCKAKIYEREKLVGTLVKAADGGWLLSS